MRVRFSQEILDRNDNAAWRALSRIVDTFSQGRHVWDIDDPEPIITSRWIAGEPGSRETQRNLEALHKCFTDAQYAPPGRRIHRLLVVVGDGGLAPDTARRCLEAPARVIVENRLSDGAFLKAMIQAFGRDDLKTAVDGEWIEIVHAGGYGEVEKRVNELLGTAPGPCRLFVLCDSDRMHPGHDDTGAIKAIRACCVHHDVPYHILHKRTIESYLPKESLVRQKKKLVLDAFFGSLTPEQQDHYNMKEGFRRNKTTGNIDVPHEHQGLFNALPSEVLSELCGGFGDDAWRCFVLPASEITAATVEDRCATNPGEMARLLDAIERLV